MKPKVFLDIKTSRLNTYATIPSRINLTSKRVRANVARPMKFLSVAAMIAYLLFGTVVAPNQSSFAAEPDIVERQRLEQELWELENQIREAEATANAYGKQGASLKSEIASLDARIAGLNSKIKAINISLDKLNREIGENTQQISTTEEKLAFNREAISLALQSMYEAERVSLVAVLLKNPNLSAFFGDLNQLLDVQAGLTDTVQRMTELKVQLLNEKENLALKKNDAAILKTFQDSQRKETLTVKDQKDDLLTATKGNEEKYQQIVAEKRATAAEIRSRIFQFLGGGQMSFEQAYEIATYAEKAVGVEASFLLAVLDRESNLGSNVGRCTYNKNPYYPDRASNPTTMHPTRDIPHFLDITKALGLDPETTQVSCPIPRDGIYGGAMGPAQFIPSTWKLYASSIEKVVGVVPNPWNNSHAFVGTALYLKDALRACSAYKGNDQIRCAAARYYAGGNWSRHLYTYGSGTLSRKLQFDEDIAVLIKG